MKSPPPTVLLPLHSHLASILNNLSTYVSFFFFISKVMLHDEVEKKSCIKLSPEVHSLKKVIVDSSVVCLLLDFSVDIVKYK